MPFLFSYKSSKVLGVTVGLGVGEEVGITLGPGVETGLGEPIGEGITLGSGLGEGEGDLFVEGVACSLALFTATPLVQTNFFPNLMHVNFFSLYVFVWPIFLQISPTLGAFADHA